MALAGGVGVAALAACGEGEVEIREVEVEKIVTVTEVQQVEVEKVVTQEVIKEVEKAVVVEKEVVVEREVEVEKVVTKIVEIEAETAARGLQTGVNLFRSDESVPLGEWNPTRGGRITWGTPGPITSLNPVRMDQWSYRNGFPDIREPLHVGAGQPDHSVAGL